VSDAKIARDPALLSEAQHFSPIFTTSLETARKNAKRKT
jgi:hypothetical protein